MSLQNRSIFLKLEFLFLFKYWAMQTQRGRLAQTKQYREIKTVRGIQKISTSFRPLLPFTNRLDAQKTYVRRIFFNNKKWQIFDKSYNQKSKLIQTGHRNYGMGAEFKVFE